MSATKTEAFILKTRDYRDTSLLAVFYTKDFGKIHGIIKGVRDSRYRYGSTLEPFSLNEILFYRRKRGGDLHQVTQVDVLDMYFDIRQDLEKLSYASYFAEALDQLVDLEESNPSLFYLLKDTLEFMSSGASPKRSARIFELKLLMILGLIPELKSCVVCGALSPEPAYFSVTLGGVHCKSCGVSGAVASRIHTDAKIPSLPVSKGALNFMEHVMRQPVKELNHVKVAQEVGEEVEKLLRRFVDFHLQNKLKSVVFLEKMGYLV